MEPDADPRGGPQALRCVGFDVDGTLYDLRSMRRRMAWLLLRSLATGRARVRDLRAVRAYRRLAEAMRSQEPAGDVAARHLARTADVTGLPLDGVRAAVRRWMLQEPLPLLSGCRRHGVREALAALRARGLKLAVLSDYPAEGKLDALGLADQFDAVVCCQDADGDGYKPHCNGFARMARAAGVRPEECAYVGDRADVDGAGALAAGMKAVCLAAPAAQGPAGLLHVKGLDGLAELLCAGAAAPDGVREEA